MCVCMCVCVWAATLPDVEHDEKKSQFVVKLSSLGEGGGAVRGRGGGQEEDEEMGQDLALLTYIMRKRKGEQVVCVGGGGEFESARACMLVCARKHSCHAHTSTQTHTPAHPHPHTRIRTQGMHWTTPLVTNVTPLRHTV